MFLYSAPVVLVHKHNTAYGSYYFLSKHGTSQHVSQVYKHEYKFGVL